MKIVFSDQALPDSVSKSLFLAGPSIRDYTKRDWRHDAIDILNKMNYDGTVLIPIPENVFYNQNPLKGDSYLNQITWEQNGRNMADIIVFWIPRDMKNGMYGLTTNFELGEDIKTGKVIYGRPDSADKVRYCDTVLHNNGHEIFNTLEATLIKSVSFLKDFPRYGIEAKIPLNLWNNSNFQVWYNNLKDSGNILSDIKVLSVFPEIPDNIFFFTAWVSVFVTSENRYKENEIIVSRTDISTIIPYYEDELGEKYVLLVKEFRSPVNNTEGYVYEFPGGSAKPDEKISPIKNALKELEEETGLIIEEQRINFISNRQLASTFSTHRSFLYKVKMTKEEFLRIKKYSDENVVFEDEYGCEKTFCVLTKIYDINNLPIDYSTLGMLFEAKI